MTAEVALISRRAVTLAADSAISIGGPGEDVKIFNSAEKIFELSETQPVGLMIYNNIDLERAPLEILARNFRSNEGKAEFATLAECADAFMKYLNDFAGNVDAAVRDEIITARLVEVFKSRLSSDQIFEAWAAQPPPVPPAIRLSPTQVQSQLIVDLQAELAAEPKIASHDTTDWLQVAADHQAAIANAVAQSTFMGQLTAAEDALLLEIGARALLSANMSGLETGIVIAGYGRDGLYPALLAYEIDGFVCGKLRTAPQQDVMIKSGEQTVDIITFAQEDISKRLLDGVDPEIASSVTRQLLGSLRAMRVEALQNVPAANRAQVEADYNAAATKLFTGIRDNVREFIAKCNDDFYSTVAAMPKQEMAFFAEALVNTTAMKRRVSKDREDVGGPVDVAVISRHEGFVWVKRKHYFDPEKNARFFARKFGSAGNGGNNGRQA